MSIIIPNKNHTFRMKAARPELRNLKGGDSATARPMVAGAECGRVIQNSKLVGIVNLTPDSFSDGGKAVDIGRLIAEGAAVIDIGAESTRPGAIPVTPEEEWTRLAPVLLPARKQWPEVIFSIDTRHPETARRALDAGAEWINDVSGGDCAAVMHAYPQAKYVLMHALTVPADPVVTLPTHVDPIEAVLAFFVEKMLEMNLHKEQLILDPGIGFGKTAEQSLLLIKRAEELKSLGLPVLFGHSRKSCFKVYAEKPAERDGATLAASLHLARCGIDYLRVHSVGLHQQALAVESVLS